MQGTQIDRFQNFDYSSSALDTQTQNSQKKMFFPFFCES